MVSSQYDVWEFQDCAAPLVIITFPDLDHALKSENVFIFTQKLQFFLGEWRAPEGGRDELLQTRNGTTFCGCCSEAKGQCDYTSRCDGKNYLARVSCPGASEIKNRCWRSSDLS